MYFVKCLGIFVFDNSFLPSLIFISISPLIASSSSYEYSSSVRFSSSDSSSIELTASYSSWLLGDCCCYSSSFELEA